VETNAHVHRLHQLVGAPSFGTLVTGLALGALALVILRAVVSMAVEYALQRYAASCQNRLARDLLTECVHAPYPWFLTRNASLLARLFYDDVSQWSRGFVQRLMSILSDGITTLFAGALLLAFAPILGVVVMAVLGAVAYGLMSWVRPKLARLSRRKREALEATLMSASQALSGIKDVKLSSREGYFIRLFDRSYREASQTHALLNLWHQIVPLGLPVVGLAGVIGIVLVQVEMGRSRGEIAAQTALLFLVSSRIVPAISQLSTSVGLLWNVAPYVQALHELRTSVADEVARRPRLIAAAEAPAWDGSWTELTLSRIGFTYPRATVPALRDVSLSLSAGRAYGLAGPSGAGKSTLVDLLLRLLDPTEGALRLDGQPMDAVDVRAWQSRIGYVPQSPFIADDTLRANVAFGVAREQIDDDWVRECLRLAHLETLLAELGLDAPLGDRGLRVSGGQRQRIAIARALYNRPRLLVLDEATSALDRISEGVIQEAIEGLRGQVTTVTIAHRLATIEHCDTIFLFEDGRLAAQGRYDELLASSLLFRRMASERDEPSPVLAHGA
jgi:ABC-type multidrug transport system fused ATPase/permease subunit